MTDEHRKTIEALVAALDNHERTRLACEGPEPHWKDSAADFALRTAFSKVGLACCNARPALKALVARLELAEVALELTFTLRDHDAQYEAAVKDGKYDDWRAEQDALVNKRATAIDEWHAAKEANDA